MIGLWKKMTGNLMSHASGLTQEQVDFFKSLKVGDRLIAWHNNRGGENSPTYTLKLDNNNQKRKMQREEDEL